MASPNRAGYGKLIDSIPAKKWQPILRACACVALGVGFFALWLYGMLTGTQTSNGRWLPLILAVVAILAAVPMATGVKKRLDIYEHGLVYHTLWFELDAPWESITELHMGIEQPVITAEYGGGLRSGPTLALHISFREERPWVFRASTYPAIAEKGEQLAAKFQQET